jgi:hypothetical protein
MILRTAASVCLLLSVLQRVIAAPLPPLPSSSHALAAQSDDLAALCRKVWGVKADGTNLRDFPASIPAPPAGARRCGARESLRAVYYVWDVPLPEILAHWDTALTRQGFRTERVGGRTPDRAFLRFAGPKGGQAGKISLSPRGGGFVIALGGSL